MRVFLAVELSAEARENAASLISRLPVGNAKVRWVAPEKLHVTVRFLGEVPDVEVPEISRGLAEEIDGVESFFIQLEGIGSFPPRGAARVIWIGITAGLENLTEVSERANRALAGSGFPPENRAFSPHVTVGRVRGGRVTSRDLEGADFPRTVVPVDGLTLFMSELSPRGPRYTQLARFEFDARR